MAKENAVFPDEMASKEDKSEKWYGLQYARAIWSAHVKNITTFNDQAEIWRDNRRYAEGLQSVDKYKSQLSLADGDLSWLNLDFSPVNRIAALTDIMEGKMMNQLYKIQCNPIDIISKTKEDEDRDKMYAAMFLKRNTGDLEQMTGLAMYPRNMQIPDTDEEAELYFKLNYKQAASIAIEQAMSFVFMNNEFDQITRKKIIRDLIVNKRAAIHRYYDEANNIRVKYVDHAKVITPYSEHDDFRNVPYIAVIENMPLYELAQITDEFDDEELEEIAKRYEGKEGNPMFNGLNNSYEGYYNSNSGAIRPWMNFNIPVLSFYFLSVCKENRVKTTKPNGRVYFDKVGEGAAPEAPNKELISKDLQWLYEGKWIIGSDKVFNYKQADNVARDKQPGEKGGYSPKAKLPIHMIAPNIYDMQNKSVVERARPHEDQLNLIGLKIQQHVIMAKPPGMYINTQAMHGIFLGQGKEAARPEDIYKMYSHTGSVVGSDMREDGSIINGKPFEFLENGIGRDFAQLVNHFRSTMEIINDVIGFNNAVDASSPDAEAVVGAAKMAIQASNNAMRPLYQAHVQLIEGVSKELALMIQHSIKFNYDAFLRAIGTQATETIKYGKDLALHQFAIKIELLPDEEERQDILNDVRIGQENGTLTTADAVTIKQVAKQDVKLAAQLLVILEAKNAKRAADQKKQEIEYNGQVQVQSGQAVAQAQMQASNVDFKNKSELIKLQGLVDDTNAEKAHGRAKELLTMKINGDIEITEIAHDNALRHTAFENSVNKEKETELV